ncbi:MAG: Hsp20/alpha crystallin family protein [Ardenticatenaceae bacterium]|nr:Hsp20/alpha crystallin family protein [Anaerolineales bacterium]MCB8921503.1 Hsp20/alpha crystallin family protein [Ardenticatenaceae bacterium]MCB8990910.1 Hsp20/alpha crystallin family protein [Ardenticatenaceae bacterium]MCB9004977.1 Hsp20/alpha crystallin family protein [Ardenticatenaceae bacterium]
MSTLVRWNPIRNRMSMFNEFDRMMNEMNEMFDWDAPSVASNWKLALDVVEVEDGYTVTASIPGINPDDIDITLENDVLTIKAETQSDETTENVRYHLRERRFGSFSRSLRFPVSVNGGAVEAKYENGVLSLNIPKAEEVKPKRIAVKTVI